MENLNVNLRQAKKLAREAMQRRQYRFMKRYGQATDDELLCYVRQCARELGFTPNAGDILGALFIKERLGSWSQVLARAGLDVTPKNERADVPGLFEREIQRQMEYHKKAVQQLEEDERNFGRLHAADTDEQLLEYLREWAVRLKHSPNVCEVVGGEYIRRRFGGWDRVMALAGLPQPPSNPPKRWNRQIYRDALRRQHELGMEVRREAGQKGRKVIYVAPK